MTDRLREAAQAALSAMDDMATDSRCADMPTSRTSEFDAAFKDLRAALAERDAEQKPAAWIREDTAITTDAYEAACWRDAHTVTPLYAYSPRREWQGLTRDEIADIALGCYAANGAEFDDFALAERIEAKLKEKNHD